MFWTDWSYHILRYIVLFLSIKTRNILGKWGLSDESQTTIDFFELHSMNLITY